MRTISCGTVFFLRYGFPSTAISSFSWALGFVGNMGSCIKVVVEIKRYDIYHGR